PVASVHPGLAHPCASGRTGFSSRLRGAGREGRRAPAPAVAVRWTRRRARIRVFPACPRRPSSEWTSRGDAGKGETITPSPVALTDGKLVVERHFSGAYTLLRSIGRTGVSGKGAVTVHLTRWALPRGSTERGRWVR